MNPPIAAAAEDERAFAPGARVVQALDAWLAARGDACLRAFATGCLWLGGAHALYLGALPASASAVGGVSGAFGGGGEGGLRGLAARRAAPRARRLAVAGVMVVAAYDALRSGQQDRRRAALDRRFSSALAAAERGEVAAAAL